MADRSTPRTIQIAHTENQDFTATPAEAATNPFSTADDNTTTADESNQGRRTYQVSGLDDANRYEVALFPAEFVTVDANGVVTFRDNDNTDADADLEGDNVADFQATDAVIELVNNNTATDTNGVVVNVAPVNGVLNFTIDSESADQVVPVIFLDADNQTAEAIEGTATVDLDLNAANEPSELFAIGGEKVFVAPLAAASQAGETGRVVDLDEGANTFALDTAVGATAGNYDADDQDVRYVYDANDVFTGPNGALLTLEAFERELSRGDGLTVGDYYTESSLPSEFTITDDSPEAPDTAAQAGVGGSANDITVTVTPTEPADADLYDQFIIQRSTQANPNTWTTIATITPADDADDDTSNGVQYVDENLNPGTYNYRAAGVIDGDQSAFDQSPATAAATAPTADQAGPLARDTELTTNGGLQSRLDATDVIKVCFNEPIAAPTAGDRLLIDDANDGDQALLTNGDNATFTLGAASTGDVSANAVDNCPANQTLVVTLTGAPADQNAAAGDNVINVVGGVAGDIIDAAGVTDVPGNAWNPAANGNLDVTIDVESGPEAQDPETGDPVAPATATTVTGGEDQFSGNGTATDNVAVSAVEYRYFVTADGAGTATAWEAATLTTAPGDASEAYTFTETGLAPGAYTVEVRAIDAAGNVSAVESDTATVTNNTP